MADLKVSTLHYCIVKVGKEFHNFFQSPSEKAVLIGVTIIADIIKTNKLLFN